MDIFNYDKMTFFVFKKFTFYVDLWTQLFRKMFGHQIWNLYFTILKQNCFRQK